MMQQISLFEYGILSEISESVAKESVSYALDPCPKCGKVPEMLTEIDERGTINHLVPWGDGPSRRSTPTEKQLYSVNCKTCYIPDSGTNAFTYHVFFTPEEAAEHWHQRVEIVKEGK